MFDESQRPETSKSSDGAADTESQQEKTIIQQPDDPGILATCRFVNRRNVNVTVSVARAYGGISNGTLPPNGGYWDVHVRSEAPFDSYCWHTNGPCNPNGSLTCRPGNTYYVG